MLNPNDRYVVRNRDGGWNVKATHAKRFSKHTEVQAEANQHAGETVRNANGGEVCIQGSDGCFRDRDTVAPRIDPTHLETPNPDSCPRKDSAIRSRLCPRRTKSDPQIPVTDCVA